MPELTMAELGYKKHLKVELFPTIWCPGCGIGTIMMQLAIVLDEMALDETNTVIVTGIGCTGRMGSYLKHESVYTLHGRTLPVAEAIKTVRQYPFVDAKRVGMMGGSHGGNVISKVISRIEVQGAVICAPAAIDNACGGKL